MLPCWTSYYSSSTIASILDSPDIPSSSATTKKKLSSFELVAKLMESDLSFSPLRLFESG